jgi:hypothetical protein
MTAALRFIAVPVFSFLLFGAGAASAQTGSLIDFEIEDQFKEKHKDDDYRGLVLCVIGSDRDGADYNGVWESAIRDSMAGRPGAADLRILRVADLRGVPFFLKGMVRGKFPQEPQNWVLMDWKGNFAKAYDWVAGVSNVALFDRDGVLLRQDSGKDPGAGTIPDIIILLQDALDTPAQL